MRKTWMVAPISALISLGLIGCAQNDEGAYQDQYTDSARPIGYYSNENHNGQNGNARLLNDNDGPLTEMMDHTLGDENRGNNRNELRNSAGQDRMVPIVNKEEGINQYDDRANLIDRTTRTNVSNEGNLAQNIRKIAISVDNVKDAQTIVYQDNAIIAVAISNQREKEITKQKIRKAVQPYLRGKNVSIVTDQGTFTRIRDLNKNMRNGGQQAITDQNFRDLINNIRD